MKNSLEKSFFWKKFLGGLRPPNPPIWCGKQKKRFSKVLNFSLPLDFSLPRVSRGHFPKLYRWMFSTAKCLYLYAVVHFGKHARLGAKLLFHKLKMIWKPSWNLSLFSRCWNVCLLVFFERRDSASFLGFAHFYMLWFIKK